MVQGSGPKHEAYLSKAARNPPWGGYQGAYGAEATLLGIYKPVYQLQLVESERYAFAA